MASVETSYPIPTYRFQVTVGQDQMAFNKVSGLKSGRETFDYRDGMDGLFRMTGQKTSVEFTLSCGMVSSQSQLWEWLKSSISGDQPEKKDISISLTDEAGSVLLITWNIKNAFPTDMSVPDFDATSNDIALEELSLSAESMTIEYH
ncbi:MAG: phage tail protein [Acidobacteriota bacterium]